MIKFLEVTIHNFHARGCLYQDNNNFEMNTFMDKKNFTLIIAKI